MCHSQVYYNQHSTSYCVGVPFFLIVWARANQLIAIIAQLNQIRFRDSITNIIFTLVHRQTRLKLPICWPIPLFLLKTWSNIIINFSLVLNSYNLLEMVIHSFLFYLFMHISTLFNVFLMATLLMRGKWFRGGGWTWCHQNFSLCAIQCK